MKKFFLFALAVIMFAACNNNQPIELTGISLKKSALELEVGDSQKLKVLYEPEEAASVAPEVTWESSDKKVASVDKKGEVTAVKKGNAIITATCGNFTAECEVTVVEKGEIPEPSTPIYFSVSADKKVLFSPGNLQFAPNMVRPGGGWVYRFAEHQYDAIGEDNLKFNDKTYLGYVDLFGWGTGNNPDLYSLEANDYKEFNDWGKNVITLPDGKLSDENTWYTLSSDEWKYLLEEREGKWGDEAVDASQLHGRTIIKYGDTEEQQYRGWILLPDFWNAPEGWEFEPGEYGDNTIDMDMWEKMEAAGAVFLTCASNMRRIFGTEEFGYKVYVYDDGGYYWCSDDRDLSDYAKIAYYGNESEGWGIPYLRVYEEWRANHLSVRLVKDYESE